MTMLRTMTAGLQCVEPERVKADFWQLCSTDEGMCFCFKRAESKQIGIEGATSCRDQRLDTLSSKAEFIHFRSSKETEFEDCAID